MMSSHFLLLVAVLQCSHTTVYLMQQLRIIFIIKMPMYVNMGHNLYGSSESKLYL